MKTQNKIFFAIFSTLVFLVPAIASATGPTGSVAAGYSLINAASGPITAWGTCYSINNTSGKSVFIPTKTSSEWSTFYNNLPSGVTKSSCCAADNGQSCNSSANSCGQTNSGTYDCSGNCSASTPGTGNYGNSCASAANSCGMTSYSGTIQCNGSCSSATPSNSLCPIYGCTDSNAFNYNSGANTNDGSCHYHGCFDMNIGQYDMSYYGGDAINICQSGAYGPDDYSNVTQWCSSVSDCNNEVSSYSGSTGVCDGYATGAYVGVIESVGSPYSCNW